jgi:hypothetical protein
VIRRRHCDPYGHLLTQIINETVIEFTPLVVKEDVAGAEATDQFHQEAMDTQRGLIRDSFSLGPLCQVLRRNGDVLVPRWR